MSLRRVNIRTRASSWGYRSLYSQVPANTAIVHSELAHSAMSDQSSPPPKKVGSLRDRIAAFEKSASSAPPPGPAPAPRPKPAGFASWKPKPPSPPSSPSATATENVGASKSTAMSASDAKESITKAGSLKERMAALQGKGAFGAPPPIAPKPAVERPKWKPPPVVHAPADEDDQAGEGSTAAIAAAVERTLSPPTSIKSHESVEPRIEGEDAASHAPPAGGDGEHEGEAAADPEEEERQRRAAIAARIARLGGARVGMAPPVFGRPPPVRRPTHEEAHAAEVPKPVEEQPKVETAGPELVKPAEPAASPPTAENTPVTPLSEPLPAAEAEALRSLETAPVRKDSEGTSVPSFESVETPPAKGLASMPIPAVPRRTGPPRKKPVKPAAPPPEVPAEVAGENTEAPAATVETEAEKTPDEVSNDASKELYDPAPTLQHEDIAPKVMDELTLPSIATPVGSDVKPDVTPEPTKHEESAPHVAISTSESHPAPQAAPSAPIDDLPTEILDLGEDASGVKAPPPSLATATPMGDSDEDSDGDVAVASKAPVAAPSHPTRLPVDLLDKELQEEIKEGIITADDDAEEIDEEAEEEARKKRIAERLAKMGGVNPFAPPPVQAKLSSGSGVASPPLPSSPPPAALAPRSPSPEPVQPTRKESLVGEQPKSKLEDSDSDYDEEDVHDDQSAPPISTHRQKEKAEATTVLAPDHIVSVPLSPPPPIPRSTRTQFPVQHDDHKNVLGTEHDGPVPPIAPIPPRPPIDKASEVGSPPTALTEPPSPPARPAQQPRRLVPSAPEDDDEPDDYQTDEEAEERLAQSHLFIPPPTDRALHAAHPRHANIQDEDDGAGNGSENDGPPLPIPHRRSMEAPPATSTRKQVQQSLSDEEEDDENAVESDHDGRALPIPPPHPATAIAAATAPKTIERKASGPPPRLVPPPPPAHPPPVDTPSPSNITPSLSVSGSEVLDEEEGDPIDPSFHSPSRQTSLTNLRGQAQAQAQVQPTALARPPPPAHSPPPAAHSPPPARSPPVPSALPARSPPHVHSPPPVRSLPLAHSPPPSTLPPPAPLAEESAEQLEEDAEQLRRKTIAERMAKLGGIKFGAPLPTPGARPPPPPARHEEEEQEQEQEQEQDQTKVIEDEENPIELTEEEEERARKERIASKLASMGGMRIGMMPMGMGALPPQRSHVLREEAPSVSPPPVTTHAPPPARAVPPARPPPPPAQPSQPHHVPDTDSEYGSAIASDDGVKVEAEESEIEEVNYEDAEPEEAPPPIPSRTSRPPVHRQESTEKSTSPPPRPPVPTSMPVRRSSVQTTGSASETGPSPPQRKTSSAYVPSAQSDYVMVEEPENQEAPPPPPARRMSRPPPTRSAPQVPEGPVPPTPDTKDSISSQWELPSIPTSTFGFEGGEPDLSLSWTDAGEPSSVSSSTQLPSSPPPPPPPAKQQQQRKASIVDKPLSADELMGVWGRVGVQVCEVATTLFERSKKALIGDGTYAGFVVAVLAGVPNAASIPVLVNRSSTSSSPDPSASSNEHTYGYLVYVQNGASVQRRASEIMPGDIVEIHDAKLKGHKGIQMYHQNVGGDGETLIGIVGEFEAKKSKIRVFHANQHVGQQTVESVSYRLEDLKSGLVKVYRVLEA
ncbi:unnamed protein product [Cyclocybe aegerita]|uniref:BBC1/AIM3 cysteine proteinase-fold domain-containing protein n=1 Tax=Cyclocybe aegerita TaxID=1973307 RepID=A0A8S0VYW0_CYCAE|nr:unnamed protein product [Cyclocybe aegerita]